MINLSEGSKNLKAIILFGIGNANSKFTRILKARLKNILAMKVDNLKESVALRT